MGISGSCRRDGDRLETASSWLEKTRSINRKADKRSTASRQDLHPGFPLRRFAARFLFLGVCVSKFESSEERSGTRDECPMADKLFCPILLTDRPLCADVEFASITWHISSIPESATTCASGLPDWQQGCFLHLPRSALPDKCPSS